MNKTSTDRIEKKIEIAAPVSRVWRALTDHRQFSKWFQADVTTPFVPGKTSGGKVTHAGFEHVVIAMTVEKMEPERLFSYRWHPCNIDPKVDYAKEPTTLVEFRLEGTKKGTLLTVTESGFDAIPLSRRAEAFRMNTEGWEAQLGNVEAHVSGKA